MMSKFFIERPVLANVLAIVLVLIGAVSLFRLPVSQYPNVVPPTVAVTDRRSRVQLVSGGTASLAFPLNPTFTPAGLPAPTVGRTVGEIRLVYSNPDNTGLIAAVDTTKPDPDFTPTGTQAITVNGHPATLYTSGNNVAIIWKLHSGFSQLKQSCIHFSCAPERCSQPTLGLFVLRILSDRFAQERHGLCRLIQPNLIDPEPEANTAHAGSQLACRRQCPRGIVELGLSIIDQTKIDVCLGQCRRKLQDSQIFMDCIIKPSLLLGLLSREKVLLNLILDW